MDFFLNKNKFCTGMPNAQPEIFPDDARCSLPYSTVISKSSASSFMAILALIDFTTPATGL